MQKIYQTFVALAAQLQSIHENVKVSSHCLFIYLDIYTQVKYLFVHSQDKSIHAYYRNS